MAGRKQATMTSAALLVVALLAIVAVAPAMAGYTMCRVDLGRMEGACEKYCATGSTEAWPGHECCNTLSRADFQCLCRLKGALRSTGNIDAGRAMQIPSKCGIPGAPASC